ncbi:MAG: glycosyl transferase family 2 [Hyphomicrobiales bacterium]|nr:glycosyl transferase family 2 [Hyphomicrobiales bacterium]
MTDVSIVIAAWNAAAFLRDSIASALAQDSVSLEVIVCDDASTDDTADVVRAFSDPRVRYLRAERNGGPSSARNMGLGVAAGEWILVLDADDEMAPSRARRLIDIGRANQADIVADNFLIRGENSAPERLHIAEALDGSFESIDLTFYADANQMFGTTPSYGYLKPIFRRVFLDEHGLRYPESMRIGEDFALVCEILARGGRYLRARSADYVYKTHTGSISHRLKRSDLASMIAFDRTFTAAHAARLTASETQAFDGHLSALLTADAFTAMLDGIKQKRVGDVLAAAISRPQALKLMSMPVRARLARLKASLTS